MRVTWDGAHRMGREQVRNASATERASQGEREGGAPPLFLFLFPPGSLRPSSSSPPPPPGRFVFFFLCLLSTDGPGFDCLADRGLGAERGPSGVHAGRFLRPARLVCCRVPHANQGCPVCLLSIVPLQFSPSFSPELPWCCCCSVCARHAARIAIYGVYNVCVPCAGNAHRQPAQRHGEIAVARARLWLPRGPRDETTCLHWPWPPLHFAHPRPRGPRCVITTAQPGQPPHQESTCLFLARCHLCCQPLSRHAPSRHQSLDAIISLKFPQVP